MAYTLPTPAVDRVTRYDAARDAYMNAGIQSAALTAVDASGRAVESIEIPQATGSNLTSLMNLNHSFSSLDMAPPVLDLNYADKMSLYGFETYTCSTTQTYTDALGNTQTAALNTAAFDRISVNGWLLPAGLKLSGDSKIAFNPVNILPVTGGYTVILDVNRPTSFSNSGNIFVLNDGTVANRATIGINGNYQPTFLVQAGGVVNVNAALGDIQSWYGGTRTLAMSVVASGFAWSDGSRFGSSLSGGAPAANTRTTLELGGGGFAGWISRIRFLPFALSPANLIAVAAGPAPVATWGDSLTFGTGGTANTNYPETLRLVRIPRSGVYNGGVGGETSTQIKTRMIADSTRNSWTNVFWVGRNNITDVSVVMADIAEMVAKLTHKRFLVLSVINKSDGSEITGTTGYNQIAAINAAIASTYPNNYLDVRTPLVAASGGANDQIGASYASDAIHLNSTGYQFVANLVSARLRAKRWY